MPLSEDPITPVKQAIGHLHQRIMAVELALKHPARCPAQLVIWDKEHDRVISAIAKHRESWHRPNPAQQAERKRMVARRDELRKLLNIEY